MMRNFDERKQEILRRAEERIRRRKKRRKQLLGIGIPLTGLIVCLALLLPAGTAARKPAAFQEFAMDAAPTMPEIPENTTAANSQIVTEDLPAEAAAADAPMEDHTHALAPADDGYPYEPMPVWHICGMGQSDTQYPGVFIVQAGTKMTEHPIEFVCRNQTEQMVAFEGYYLQMQENDQWVNCELRSDFWSSEAFEVCPESQGVFTYFYLDQRWFHIPGPGRYRIVATFRVGDDSTQYTMWADFTLEEEE